MILINDVLINDKSVYHGLSRFLFFERLRSILKLLKGLGLSCVKSFFQ